jgi:hypothetical protein
MFLVGIDSEVVSWSEFYRVIFKGQSSASLDENDKFMRCLVIPEPRFRGMAMGDNTFDSNLVAGSQSLQKLFWEVFGNIMEKVGHLPGDLPRQ